MISVVTLGEVFYLLWRNKGEGEAHATISNLRSFPLRIFDVDLALALKAGDLKARQKLPYVDSIVASLALDQHATIVTSDRDFEKFRSPDLCAAAAPAVRPAHSVALLGSQLKG
jgi:predicted nucleic acid-binding protein